MLLSNVLDRCMESDSSIQVTVVYSPGPRQVQVVSLSMDPGSSVLHALQTSGLLQLSPLNDQPPAQVGVWGRQASLTQPLRDHDRVEIYRALTVDPKVARRERFAKQGAQSAGLFSKKRAGAAAGY